MAFGPDGRFKLLQFTDTHYISGDPRSERAMRCVEEALDAEKPDLVIHTGDLLFGRPDIESAIEILKPISERGIPFAVALGNHDSQFGSTRQKVFSAIRELPGCLNTAPKDGVYGCSNDVITLGKGPEWVFYLFDSMDAVILKGEEEIQLKQFLFPVLRGEFRDPEKKMDCYLDALAELTIVGSDPTAALRFNILVNRNPVVENVIANGAIFATKLGSTGYFKSVARTIFTSGIGVGFICPTYSVPNIVVSSMDKIEFELARDAEIVVSGDKLVQKINAEAGWKLAAADAAENIAVFGYDHFMCPECRKNRNSTVVNDNYCIV